MRIIANFEKENLAKRFSLFLEKEKIENSLEDNFDKKLQKTIYNIWVHNEDDLIRAVHLYNEFLDDPMNLKFDVRYEELDIQNEEKRGDKKFSINSENIDSLTIKKPFPYKVTFVFLIACIILYFVNYMQEIYISKKYNLKELFLLTNIQKQLLFDLPENRLELDQVIINYNLDSLKKMENPPIEAQKEIQQIENKPSWIGFSDIVLQKLQKKNASQYFTAPMFVKIRQGEVWRLFTPVLLHSGFLHILFNMIWLWYLGKQMEPKLRFIRYLLFIVFVAVLSNTAQYLMGGPYFLGFSGVVTGMIGYIYVRQKVAPWEGYTIPNVIFYFIAIYILAMVLLQISSFVLQAIKPKLEFSPGIANTAHIAGAVIGMILAKIPFFNWRTSER